MNVKISLTIILASFIVSMVFLGIQARQDQVEAIHTTCIFPYDGEAELVIEYQWGSGLGSPSAWKTAFSTSVSDWNATNTVITFNHDASGGTTLQTYTNQDNVLGSNHPICGATGGQRSGNTTKGNVYYDTENGYNANERRSITGHELGHALGLWGYPPDWHSSDSNDLLYGSCCPSDTRYTPQSGDEDETNNHYTVDP